MRMAPLGVIWFGLAASAAELPPLVALRVDPAEVTLHGLRSQQQLLVSGELTGATADLTREASYESLTPTIAIVTPQGVVIPRGQGSAMVRVQVGEFAQMIAVTVQGIGDGEQIDFRTEVIAALSRAGCNQGACHGSPQGKGGFRLSLRGFDPALDFETLTKEFSGRRTNVQDADRSLLLLKALGETPHQGGKRFERTDPEYQILRTWIHQGRKPSSQLRSVTRLEVIPAARRLPEARPQQQLIALAHFSDGTVQDVTHLAGFDATETRAATITKHGLVTFDGTAEAAFLVRYLDKVTGARLTFVERDPSFTFRASAPRNFIDEHVFQKQAELQIQPADVAADEVFLRRVFLDVIGTLPSADEARVFLDSRDPAKRSQLIDQLLDREEFAPFWALKWADLLRGSEVTISQRGVFSLHRYLVDLFRDDRPMTEFARETLTGLGNTLHHPEANFFRVARTPDDMAEAMSQLFLGVRIGCAKCHNHPFESITQADYYGFAAYFARVKFKGTQFGLDDEIVYLDRQGDVRHPLTNQIVPAAAFGHVAEIGPTEDRRKYLADWLTAEDNPYFARSITNRVWFHLFGRGIVEPVDDFRETNPPSNPELLAELAREFAQQGYRLRPVLRQILNSQTYQLSAQPAAQSAQAAPVEKYFSQAQARMLTGEQILDAISQAIGIPAEFANYPPGTRAVELAEGTTAHPFLQAFGKPVRDSTCECSRDSDPSISQVIHLLNSPEILGNITRPAARLSVWLAAGKTDAEVFELMYLTTLSRRPTNAETTLFETFRATAETRSAAFADWQHALLNSNEFLLRH